MLIQEKLFVLSNNMKKNLSIIFFSLLWCNIVSASELKQLNISISCYETGEYLNHLDRSKKDHYWGFLMETNSYDGEKKPEFNLMISLEKAKSENWNGEIIFFDRNGKILFKPKSLNMTSGDLGFNIAAVHKGYKGNSFESLLISQRKTTETKENYYKVEHIKIYDLKDALSEKNKEIKMFSRDGFNFYTETSICFE